MPTDTLVAATPSYSPTGRRRPTTWLLAVTAALAAATLLGCSVKPQPLTDAEVLRRMAEDQGRIYAGQEPVTGPMSLPEVLARALKYNFDRKLALMETALQNKNLAVASMNMLPRLAADAGYNIRSNQLASSSESIKTHEESLEPSTSQDRALYTADLAFSWNLLDLGVSYYQAKQQANRFLVAQERQRRVVNNIVKEAQSLYWRVLTVQEQAPLIAETLAEVEAAQARTKEIEERGLQPLLQTLEQQKGLFQIGQQLRRIQSDYALARAQLAAIINAPAGADIVLRAPEDEGYRSPALRVAPEDLQRLSLFHRSDLREEDYQERIDLNGVNKEILRMLPGVTLLSSYNLDSNSYLVHHAWAEAGVRASYNLFSLFTQPKQIDAAKAQMEVTRVRRQALTVAALVQVNLGYLQYRLAQSVYQAVTDIAEVEKRLARASADAARLNAQSDLDRLRRSASSLAARLDQDRGLVEMYNAINNIYTSVGFALYSGSPEAVSLADLTAAIETTLTAWSRGALPRLPEEPAGEAS